jgi:hypothetical protein
MRRAYDLCCGGASAPAARSSISAFQPQLDSPLSDRNCLPLHLPDGLASLINALTMGHLPLVWTSGAYVRAHIVLGGDRVAAR